MFWSQAPAEPCSERTATANIKRENRIFSGEIFCIYLLAKPATSLQLVNPTEFWGVLLAVQLHTGKKRS